MGGELPAFRCAPLVRSLDVWRSRAALAHPPSSSSIQGDLIDGMFKLGETLTDGEAEEMLKIAKKKDDFVRTMTASMTSAGGAGPMGAGAPAGGGGAGAPAGGTPAAGGSSAGAAAPKPSGGLPPPPGPGGGPRPMGALLGWGRAHCALQRASPVSHTNCALRPPCSCTERPERPAPSPRRCGTAAVASSCGASPYGPARHTQGERCLCAQAACHASPAWVAWTAICGSGPPAEGFVWAPPTLVPRCSSIGLPA